MTALRRFFVDGVPQDGYLYVVGDELHHIRDVTRLRCGHLLEITDGRGWVHQCHVEDFEHNRLRLAVISSQLHPPSSMRLWLVISLLKGKAMNFVVERLTEMGIDRISPVILSRADVQQSNESKSSKWLKIAEQAIKVNDNPWLPKIDDPMTLDDVIRESVFCPVKIFLDLDAQMELPKMNARKVPVLFLVGPPGGLTDIERTKMREAGFLGVRISPWTLRSETAAMYAAAWLDSATREWVVHD